MTFRPKLFYRNLKKLLHQIEVGAPNEDWLVRLVVEIVESFGEERCIDSGRVYSETPEDFRLDRGPYWRISRRIEAGCHSDT